MNLRVRIAGLVLLAALGSARAAEPLVWHGWSPEIFAQAKRENKFLLLDLEAVWCHWCHVMAGTTYRDPAVVALMNTRYLAVRVDQDARPDLASRYEDYGWPATVIFGPDGTEIVKKQGYIPPSDMMRLLQTVIDDPSPVVAQNINTDHAVTGETALPAARRDELHARWAGGYDDKEGGWGFSHKYLDADTIEYALRRAARGDTRAAQMARDTLRLSRKLLDPVWGGLYQYSAGGTWDEPHFEKIMSFQADTLRANALAAATWGDPAFLENARAVHGYLRRFLTNPAGVVYTSQDADLVPGEHSADYFALDDAGRRARGVPRIDRHIYARENG
ncbi:MAG: thioredoxin domain-containing protein, partial [Gammaproteobacteria bacterium]|nr:thioredoxin domain-containing protein [Gammaproteobacteria bacterium]